VSPEAPTLKDRLATEMREALKAQEKTRLGALRLLLAAVQNREVELRHELNDEEFVEVVARQVKQRRESEEAYTNAGREELAAHEREERGILEAYMPAQLGDAEVDALVEEAIATTGASQPGDMGKVMGFVMTRAKGRVDGKAVQAKVRERLGA
jgi:uncharacterized protein YqeY